MIVLKEQCVDGEVLDVVVLISLLESHCLRLRRREVRIWGPLEGFLCKSFFQCMVNPMPAGESVLSVVWRIKAPRKVRFFSW